MKWTDKRYPEEPKQEQNPVVGGLIWLFERLLLVTLGVLLGSGLVWLLEALRVWPCR